MKFLRKTNHPNKDKRNQKLAQGDHGVSPPKALTDAQRETVTQLLTSLDEINKQADGFTRELEEDENLSEWIPAKESTITIRIIVIIVRGSEPRL